MNIYTKSATLVPITVVIHRSWNHLVSAFSLLFRLMLVRWIIEAMLVGFCLGILGTAGMSALISHSLLDQSTYLSTFTSVNTSIFFIGVSMIILLYFFTASLLHIATIFAISHKEHTASITAIFHLSFSKFLPFLFSQMLCFLFITGGFFAFILPGIGMLLFFTFVPYIVVFEGKKGMAALQRSLTLIASHPISLIGRFLLLWTFGIFVNFVLYSGLFHSFGYLSHILLVVCINMVFLWYCNVYIYVLYKEAIATAKVKKLQPLQYTVLLSLAGWGIAIFLLTQVYGLVKTVHAKDFFFLTPDIPSQAHNIEPLESSTTKEI